MTVVSIVYTYRQTAQKERERGKKKRGRRRIFLQGNAIKSEWLTSPSFNAGTWSGLRGHLSFETCQGKASLWHGSARVAHHHSLVLTLYNPVCLATKNAGSLYKSPFILRFTWDSISGIRCHSPSGSVLICGALLLCFATPKANKTKTSCWAQHIWLCFCPGLP